MINSIQSVNQSLFAFVVLLESSQASGPTMEVYEGVFKPFMMVMQEKKTQPTILALELLSKLFDYGYWQMHIPGMHGALIIPPTLVSSLTFLPFLLYSGLIGLMTETISSCFVSEITDQKIQTLVLKVAS